MPTTGDEDLFTQLQETLASNPSNASHHYNLGLYLWERGMAIGEEESKAYLDKASEYLVAAAKLNPGDGAAFRLLGHYYSRVSVDEQRGAKCYQRAVNLNPEDFEAGEALCDLLNASGKESLEVAVCREASEKSPRAFWAFRRLGYLMIHQKKWPEAVQSLQHAIRGYPGFADLWEVLGLAYQQLGMYTAAIKAYARAIELEDSRVFGLIESGNTTLLLGSYRKGVEQFRRALEIAPEDVSAHFGLGSALLGWSKECINSGAFSWGAVLLEEASKVAIAGTLIMGNVSSVWKLHGDIQIAYAKCLPWGDETDNLNVDGDIFKTSIDQWKKACILAAKSAKQSYQRALHLTPWQANIYADVAISLDLVNLLEEKHIPDLGVWQLPEKMSLGALLLEGVNTEFWVTLGCLSNDHALKQHALARGLQLDISLSTAWAYLGKFYRELGEKQLARQAFDHARSIDPALALPWAGMSVELQDGKCSASEAFESCLRAVQIFPLAEYQLGLGSLAAVSGHLLSPQVFAAVRQAVQRAPYYPEIHNLNGLVCEARSEYHSAIAAYRRARFTLHICHNSKDSIKPYLADVSVNLARSLCKAGLVLDATKECEDLKDDGMLDSKGFQVYAVALWKLGRNDLALTAARNLAENVPGMNQQCAAAALKLICTLIYRIKGQDRAASVALKFPKEFSQTTKLRFIVAALYTLDPSCKLQPLLPANLQTVACHDVVTEILSVIAIHKMIRHGSGDNLEINNGINYLKRALHMYPESKLLRSHLGSLLLSAGDWAGTHMATRCVGIPSGPALEKCIKSPYKIHGAAGVACYASSAMGQKFSFPTCNSHALHGACGTHYLQKWLHQEPWNHEAHYLLVLNMLQRAREEKFPPRLCISLKRLIVDALSKGIYSEENGKYMYQRFLLLLCASEISLQSGDYIDCISCATNALRLLPSYSDPFFAHLQLCRTYAAQKNLPSLLSEYVNCLQVKTHEQVGWISLKYLEYRYKLQKNLDTVDIDVPMGSTGTQRSLDMSEAIFSLVSAQSFIWDQDFIGAEQALAHSCSVGNADSCLLLCHGAICMELARQHSGSQFLWRAVSSLTKARENANISLPIVSSLLAQAEASLGAREKWERNLRFEWFAWPAEMRPAELYFQMHLLARQPNTRSDQHTMIESTQSSQRWVLRAIHMNPSCLRYWKVLQKLTGA